MNGGRNWSSRDTLANLVILTVMGAGSAAATLMIARRAGSALKPGGSAIVAGLGFDHQGRLHTVNPGTCQTPGSMNRMTSDAAVDRTVTVGICPFGLAFADVPEADED